MPCVIMGCDRHLTLNLGSLLSNIYRCYLFLARGCKRSAEPSRRKGVLQHSDLAVFKQRKFEAAETSHYLAEIDHDG